MITVTAAFGAYDRTRPLADGRITPDRCRLEATFLPPQELFRRAVTEAPFEVSELSASSHIIQVAQGTAKYVALPIFLARSFRFDAIYVRSDRGIERPCDLAGKRVGVPEFQLTMAVWLRGILQDEFGVDFHKLAYVTGGVHVPGRQERIPLSLPASVNCVPAPAGQTLNDMLRDGELDALISPYPPESFINRQAGIRRLFRASVEDERAYLRRTGIFPIMHVVGLRKERLTVDPGLPRSLFDAFAAARQMAIDELRAMQTAPAMPLMLPWLAHHIDRSLAALGPDPWPYGLAPNRREIETLCRYLHEQHLIDRVPPLEEIFVDTSSLNAGTL